MQMLAAFFGLALIVFIAQIDINICVVVLLVLAFMITFLPNKYPKRRNDGKKRDS